MSVWTSTILLCLISQKNRIRQRRSLLLTSLTDASRADFHIFPSILNMEAILSSETSVNTTSTRCHIPEDCFLHSHRRENLKSYILLSNSNKYLVMSRRRGSTPRLTDWLAVSRNVTLTLTLWVSSAVGSWGAEAERCGPARPGAVGSCYQATSLRTLLCVMLICEV
jgi:hypothetical protein